MAKLEAIVKGSDAIARNRALLDYIDQLNPAELQDAVAHFSSLGITNERSAAAWIPANHVPENVPRHLGLIQ